MLAQIAHYFAPDHIQGTVLALIALAGAIGGSVVLIAKAILAKKEVTTEAEVENDEIRNKTIELLKQQNQMIVEQNELLKQNNAELERKNAEFQESVTFLTESVSNLNSKVNQLTHWFEVLACLNAPGCTRRDCPNRRTMTEMISGEFNMEDLATLKHGEDAHDDPGTPTTD
jgi:hypothetical protein